MELARLGVHDSVATVFPPGRLRTALADLEIDVVVVGADGPPLSTCDGVVTFAHDDAFLDAVDWVHSVQAGYDRFPLDAFEAREITLTNSAGIHGPSVGETVAGYMLAFARRLHRHVENATARRWEQPAWDEAFTLAGESACVVGLGTLGSGIARRATALEMRVTGVRRSTEPVSGIERVYANDELHDAIATARFVTLATPLTAETRGLIGPAEFEVMREDAYLINVSRGAVVDEDALVAALEAGEIAGAALDVFETEPLPESSPLWGMDEVIVTPHCAAFARGYYQDVADIVRENVERFGRDEPLKNRVI